MYQLIIAEKPSVAQSIAAVLGAKRRETGYLEGGGYLVSWCFGHLAELASAETYNEAYAKWRYEDLPIVPFSWRWKISRDKWTQFEILKTLLHREDVGSVINACDALRQEAEEQGEVYGRALRIGCFASIARASLPELLRKFRKLHPEIKVDVLVQGSELAAALEEDRIQLAIVDENCARGFQWTPLTDAPLVAVTPKDFPWTESTISLARLLQEPFLSCPEQYVEQYLPADTPRLEVAASDDGAILSMVAGGLGVSVLSAFSLAGYENQVRVIPLDRPLSRRLGVAVKSMPAANSPARLFLAFLKRQYQTAAQEK